MTVKAPISVMCYFLVLFVTLPICIASVDESLVDEVFTIQRQQLLRVNTIDMPYNEIIEYGEHLRNSGTGYASHGDRFNVCRFRMEGEKFRLGFGLEGSERKPDEGGLEITAFDLDNYQIYEQEEMHLTIPKRQYNQMGRGNIPYQNTYKWLFRFKKDYSFYDFQDKSSWNELKQRITDAKAADIDGQGCIVMEFDYSDRGQRSRIHFAKDFDYFPIKIEVFQGDLRLIEHVVTIEKVETKEGTVMVPIRTEETQWDNNQGSLYFRITHNIDKEKLFVNKDLPDDIFTIPRHTVWSYTNMLSKSESFYINDVMTPSIDDNFTTTSITQTKELTQDDNLSSNADEREALDISVSNSESNNLKEKDTATKFYGIVIFILALAAGGLFLILRKRTTRE